MNWSPSKYPLIINPYDSFMKKHLQHYGYFTGRNMQIARFGYEPKRGIKNEESDESDSDSDNDSENSNRAKNKIDWKTKAKCHELKIDNYKWWLKDNALFNMGLKDGEYQREPRWPIEMQVLPDKIRHIDNSFPQAEPFYSRTGFEETPMCCINDSKAKTVFYYNPINCGYFIRSRVGGNRDGCQKICADIPEIELESTLLFESRFESGNLMKAIKVNDREYELYMRYDLYTMRHTQWFYFQVKNAKPDVEYRFTICNFLKNDSLYNNGMKPVMYSEMDAKTKGIGWRRWGKDIKYFKNNIRSEDDNGISRSLYSLTWTCKFPNADDTYYFAHCYPYTYSDLQDYVREIQEDPVKSKFCKVKVLCRTLAENLVYLITITNPTSCDQENVNKKGVVISARVHPGETNSSYMMKGFLDFLLGSTADAKLLRDNFVFKMIPMLNPDGVIIGNYRCSLTGRDLNRNYKTVLKEAFPSIWHTREMIKKFMEEREVILYCDLHGHSRKNNVFIYGCHNNGSPKRRFQEHVFPMIMSKNAKDQFSYKSCKFKVQKSKQGTGRVVMWNLGIMNSFTMEATFNGSTLNQKAGQHFSQRDLEQLGYLFLDSLLDYCDPDQTKCKNILNEIEMSMREQIRTKLESQGIKFDEINLIEDFESFNFNFDDEQEESSAASDSSGDDGLPLHLERFAKLRQRKKRKVKTRKTALSQPNEKPCKNPNQKKDKLTGPTAPTVVSASKEKETLLKEQEKKMLRPLVGQSQTIQIQQLPQHPKSAKSYGNGIPLFTHERAEERAAATKKPLNQNIQLQLDTEGVAVHADPHLLTFRYNLPSEIQLPGNFNPHNHLCEHHRKKLSDLFILRHLSNEENSNKLESETGGDASDVDADEEDEQSGSGGKHRPTLEEYVKKHVFTNRAESTTNIAVHRYRRTKTSQPNLFGSRQPPYLEIRNQQQQQGPSIHHHLKDSKDETNSRELDALDINRNHNESHVHKTALDLMPKYVLKQINEKNKVRHHEINPNLTGNSAQQQSLIQRGNIGETATTATSAIGPHNSGMINAKSLVTASDQIQLNNTTTEGPTATGVTSTRRNLSLSKSTNKIHTIQSLSQKQNQTQVSLNLSVQSTSIQNQQQQLRLNSSSKMNNVIPATEQLASSGLTASKINEEFLNSIVIASHNNNNLYCQTAPIVAPTSVLFSSAFVNSMSANGQLKSNYDKIANSRTNSRATTSLALATVALNNQATSISSSNPTSISGAIKKQ